MFEKHIYDSLALNLFLEKYKQKIQEDIVRYIAQYDCSSDDEIYEAIEQSEHMALHELKSECGITKETSGQFDRALTNLQKNLFMAL